MLDVFDYLPETTRIRLATQYYSWQLSLDLEALLTRLRCEDGNGIERFRTAHRREAICRVVARRRSVGDEMEDFPRLLCNVSVIHRPPLR